MDFSSESSPVRTIEERVFANAGSLPLPPMPFSCCRFIRVSLSQSFGEARTKLVPLFYLFRDEAFNFVQVAYDVGLPAHGALVEFGFAIGGSRLERSHAYYEPFREPCSSSIT